MHAVCGNPVKSQWLKAIAAGNFIGWPLLNVQNVKKILPRNNRNTKGTYESNLQECEVDKGI